MKIDNENDSTMHIATSYSQSQISQTAKTLKLSYLSIKSILYPTLSPIKQKVLTHLLTIITNQIDVFQNMLPKSNSNNFISNNFNVLSEDIAAILNLTNTKNCLCIYSYQNSFTIKGKIKKQFHNTRYLSDNGENPKEMSFSSESSTIFKKKKKQFESDYSTINKTIKVIPCKESKNTFKKLDKARHKTKEKNQPCLGKTALSNKKKVFPEKANEHEHEQHKQKEKKMSSSSFDEKEIKTELNESFKPRAAINKMIYNTYKNINQDLLKSKKKTPYLEQNDFLILNSINNDNGHNEILSDNNKESTINQSQVFSSSQCTAKKILDTRCKSAAQGKIKSKLKTHEFNINKPKIPIEQVLDFDTFKNKTIKDFEQIGVKPSNFAKYLVKKYKNVVDDFEKLNTEEENKYNQFAQMRNDCHSKSLYNLSQEKNMLNYINRSRQKLENKMGMHFGSGKKEKKVENYERIIVNKQK